MRLKPFYAIPRADWIVRPKALSAGNKEAESVRQWMLRELASSYFFPRDWLVARTRLTEDASIAIKVSTGLFGFYLANSKGDPFLWVSVQKPGKSKEAENNLRLALASSPFAHLGLSTDGTEGGTLCLRQRTRSQEVDIVQDIEPFTISNNLRAIRCFRAPSDKAMPGTELEPIAESLEDVFFEAHSHIRDIDGMHAGDALDELCKVLYAKLFDEENAVSGEPYILQSGLTATTEEFASLIRRVYRDANEYDVRVFSLKIPGYDRSRGVFNSDIELSSPALVKVVETLQSFWLSRSSIDVKGRAFQRVLGPTLRAGMGQYFTPLNVIQFVVEVVAPQITELILDPFAGSGHFLTRSLDNVRSKAKQSDDKRLHEFAFNKLHGIEKSDRMVRIAMTDMRLHGDGHSNIRCTDALLDFQNYPDIRPESFDVVLTNPPFGSLLGPEAIARLGSFALAKNRRNVPLEVLGLERCIQFLRPGGRLAIVLPDGILANAGADYVRQWLVEHVKIRAIVSLPIESFAPFGANIKTSVLFARKWKSGERRNTAHNVHLIGIDNVGYDATGRTIAGSELASASLSLRNFLNEESW